MDVILALVPGLPLLGFAVLALFGRRMAKAAAAWIGVGSVGVSAALALAAAVHFFGGPAGQAHTVVFWKWFAAGGLAPAIAFRLDAMSLLFVLVVTFVGFMIHLYSAEFMRASEGYSRFFAYMNLFVASMLTLVLADNLVVLYLGWEGVGLCSYLLIGFWYRDAANGRAARKAFIVTRVGDTAFAVGLFLLFTRLGSLDIQTILREAAARWPAGSTLAVATAALLLGGAVGKSAQLPLQTWLPDAMAGPTPVSALIHAATMVTAGVYLIARMNVLYTLAPAVALTVAVIGAATLLISGATALVQVDIKRILAYSTISQIGYMFLALGVGAFSAAVFHFMTHAFFKSLLFLGAGVIIQGLAEEHDIFKMGGLKREMPLVFWTFLAAAASLSALPLVTAGFYSKDWILVSAWSAPRGGGWLLAAGLVGAFLTVLYAFRIVFVVFFGPAKKPLSHRPGRRMTVPLLVLAALSLAAGFLETPRFLGNVKAFSEFMRPVLPAPNAEAPAPVEAAVEAASIAVVLVGLYLAYLLYLRGRRPSKDAAAARAGGLRGFLFSGWGFDRLYDRLFVRPLTALAEINRNDIVDLPFRGLAAAARVAHRVLSATQTGRLRWYAAALVAGAILIVTVAVFL